MNIKEARENLKEVTRHRAAKWLGISPRTLECWEYGTRTIPPEEEQRILGLYEALSYFGPDFYAKLDSGECAIEQAVKDYKIYVIRDRFGSGGVVEHRWAMIPPGVKDKCSAEELAKIMELLAAEYDAGAEGN